MNNNILSMVKGTMVAALFFAFVGCSTDELGAVGDSGRTVSVSVSDGGYTSDNDTRAAEIDYSTSFTEGDKIGVFAVVDGEVNYLVDNLCLTRQSDGSWQDTGGKGPALIDGATYYAYYPYTDGTTIDATQTTADGVFASLINGWTPKIDQSIYADYTASDLMIANAATVSDNALSFTMAHQMQLVVMDFPKTTYKFADENVEDYTTNSVVAFNGISCYKDANGLYRYLVNPNASATTISGSYASGTREFSLSLSDQNAKGAYKLLNIDGGRSATPIDTEEAPTVDVSALTDWYEVASGTVTALDGTNGDFNDKVITIGDGAVVAINNIKATAGMPPIRCNGNVTLILSGESTFDASASWWPALEVFDGYTLTIEGNGTLIAKGGSAGIGSKNGEKCGNIVINGGTIIATGGHDSAGIGSAGWGGSCGNITIMGGNVTATGSGGADAIGCGSPGTCGTITYGGGAVVNGVTYNETTIIKE